VVWKRCPKPGRYFDRARQASTTDEAARSRSVPSAVRRVTSASISMHCSPAPPCTSPRVLTPLAIALFRPMPQVIAMRATAIEGACGPWSTDETRAASRSRSCPAVGASPRNSSQMTPTKVVVPISS
jgi:hypothetical protein